MDNITDKVFKAKLIDISEKYYYFEIKLSDFSKFQLFENHGYAFIRFFLDKKEI